MLNLALARKKLTLRQKFRHYLLRCTIVIPDKKQIDQYGIDRYGLAGVQDAKVMDFLITEFDALRREIELKIKEIAQLWSIRHRFVRSHMGVAPI